MRHLRIQYIVIGIAAVGAIFVIVNAAGLSRITHGSLLRFEASMRAVAQGSAQNQQGCEEHVNKLLAEISHLKMLADENEHLRRQLGFFQQVKYNYQVANVISRDPMNSALVYLDAGQQQGVIIGQPVVLEDGIVIGKVAKVSGSTSVVELVTAESTRFAVMTQSQPMTVGVAKGYLGNAIRLEYVQDNAKIAPGDIVVTSGIEPLVPKGLLVGKIQEIDETHDQLFQTASMEPLVNLSDLSVVSVIKGL